MYHKTSEDALRKYFEVFTLVMLNIHREKILLGKQVFGQPY